MTRGEGAPLRVLLVEDSRLDADLTLRRLAELGRAIDSLRVEDEPGLRAALATGAWDVILADWRMPRFDGARALAVARELAPEVPFILLSGMVGEAAAVEAMRAGASDYILKDQLARLVPAVERELREAAARRARHAAEAALRQSERRQERLLQGATSVGVTVSDAAGVVRRANAVFLAMTGYTDEDLAAGRLDLHTLTPPERQEEEARARADRGEGGALAMRRTVYRRKDGARVPVLEGASRLDAEETVTFVVDASEHRRVEDALAVSERRYRRLAESGMVGLAVVSLDGRVLEANEAYCRPLGYTSAEVTSGKVSWTEATPPEWRAADERAVSELRANGVAPLWEKEMWAKDGSRVPVMVTVTMLDDAHCLAVVLDQSERKRAERALALSQERLRQAQRLDSIGRLAAGIAHDFNNLLSIVMSCSSMLIDDLRPGDPVRTELEEIHRAGQHAAGLIQQLLVFSRRQVLKPVVVDLGQALGQLEKILRRLLGEHVTLTTTIGPGLHKVRVDPGQFEQVMINLAVNGRDAMPDGGTLAIEARNTVDPADRSPQVLLSVRDSGVGMDAATAMRVFEPFFTTKEQGKGTGLGLATVHGIVEQSGGAIEVESAPGQGATFRIRLPAARDGAEVTGAPVDLGPAHDLHGHETILLVEDDEAVRRVAVSILRRYGYQVLEAQNGGEALLVCEQHAGPIDLMVTDAIMPRMSGRQLVRRLEPLRPAMKVLYMSGYTDEKGTLTDEVHFLQKPFTPAGLAARVRAVLDAGRDFR